MLFNIGTLSLASLAAAGVFVGRRSAGDGGRRLVTAASASSPAPSTSPSTWACSASRRRSRATRAPWRVWRERFAWLLPHYVVYGFIGGVIAIAYDAVGLLALAVFAVPLLLMRKTQEAYLKHTQRSAAEAPRGSRDDPDRRTSRSSRPTGSCASARPRRWSRLSATVDARDAYTAGHSRRVQQLALAIGRELGLSQAELDLLGHAALFHDIGKLAIPDAILLKPASLTDEEWALMQRHADEGARIIDRLGFLSDAVPAIRHHHERFDGTGYPDGLARGRDPARRADHPRRRRARLDADDADLPRRPAGAARRSPSCGAPPAPSSARAASPRSSGSCRTESESDPTEAVPARACLAVS